MKRYVIRRLLMAIPLLLAISFICFVFINIIPSNPAEVALRVQQMPVITEEAIAEMEEMLGLNKPFLVRYFDWVLGCLRGGLRHQLRQPRPHGGRRAGPLSARHPTVGGCFLRHRAGAEHPYRLPLRGV